MLPQVRNYKTGDDNLHCGCWQPTWFHILVALHRCLLGLRSVCLSCAGWSAQAIQEETFLKSWVLYPCQSFSKKRAAVGFGALGEHLEPLRKWKIKTTRSTPKVPLFNVCQWQDFTYKIRVCALSLRCAEIDVRCCFAAADINTHTRTHIDTRARTHAHTHKCKHKHTLSNPLSNTHTHTLTHTHTHTLSLTHTHTHTQTHSSPDSGAIAGFVCTGHTRLKSGRWNLDVKQMKRRISPSRRMAKKRAKEMCVRCSDRLFALSYSFAKVIDYKDPSNCVHGTCILAG